MCFEDCGDLDSDQVECESLFSWSCCCIETTEAVAEAPSLPEYSKREKQMEAKQQVASLDAMMSNSDKLCNQELAGEQTHDNQRQHCDLPSANSGSHISPIEDCSRLSSAKTKECGRLLPIGLSVAVILSALLLTCCVSASQVSSGRLDVARFKRQESEAVVSDTTTTPASSSISISSEPSERPKSKIPSVNYTRVDELFNEQLNDDALVEKWTKMDKTMTEGVRAALKVIFPHVVAMSSDAKVSGACSGAILKWILNLRNMRTWAVKMLDATGKPAAGILEGALTMFGNYRECLRIRAPDEDEMEYVDEFREYFRGQYCVLQMRPYAPKKPQFYSLNSTMQGLLRQSYKYYERNVYDDLSELAMAFNFVNIRADICVPSLCSRDDIQRVADFLAKKMEMRARVQRCDVMPMEGEKIWDDTQLIWSLAFLFLFLLVVFSTALSTFLNMREQSKSKAHSLLTSMSIYKSLSHMGEVQLDRINDSKPAFLYTLRLIVVAWICLCSITNQLDFQYLREMLVLRDIIMLWPLQIIVNNTLSFESLILLTAFTYSYSNINSNLKDLIKYNIGKYARLMPSIMFMVAVTIATPLFHKNLSPVWHDFVDKPAETWIFCVELQLCILAIPIVYLMNKNYDNNNGRFKLASGPILTLILVTLFGCVINFFNIYQNSLPAAWFETFPDKEDRNLYFTKHLCKTWSHLISFAVGLFAGHLCRCQSISTFCGRPYGRKCCNALMLITSGLTMSALIFCTYTWSISGLSHVDSPLMSALYGSLAPLFWSISWALILFYLTVPDVKNQLSALARLLTFDVNLIRLGRLTFLAYLINPYVNTFVLAIQEQAIFSNILMLAHTFIGNLVVTFACAIFVSALIELPCRRLIKKLLGSRRQCTNLGIITRQLNIRHENEIPKRDLFNTQQVKAAQQPMIPLK